MFPAGVVCSQMLIPFPSGDPAPDPAIPTGPARYWRVRFPLSQGLPGIVTGYEVEMIAGGVVQTGSYSASSGTAAAAFDGNTGGTPWGGATPAGEWLAVDLGAGNEATIDAVRLYLDGTYARPAMAVLESSDDGTAWAARASVDHIDGLGAASAWQSVDVSTLPQAYVCDGRAAWGFTAATSRTLTGVQFGPERADRLIVVAVFPTLTTAGTRSITGVTIGGVAASLVVENMAASNRPIAIYAARPTGLSGDVVVTCDANFDRLSMVAVHIMAPGAASATDTDAAEITFAIPAGGVGIAAMGIRDSNKNPAIEAGLSDQDDPQAPDAMIMAGPYNAAPYNSLQLAIEISAAGKTKTFAPWLPIIGAAWAF